MAMTYSEKELLNDILYNGVFCVSQGNDGQTSLNVSLNKSISQTRKLWVAYVASCQPFWRLLAFTVYCWFAYDVFCGVRRDNKHVNLYVKKGIHYDDLYIWKVHGLLEVEGALVGSSRIEKDCGQFDNDRGKQIIYDEKDELQENDSTFLQSGTMHGPCSDLSVWICVVLNQGMSKYGLMVSKRRLCLEGRPQEYTRWWQSGLLCIQWICDVV
ncbi:hypothetical protein Gotur_001396 [Gossypium turneri]